MNGVAMSYFFTLLADADPGLSWTDLIERLGFPVALCVALCWFLYALIKRNQKQEDVREETYRKLVDQHTELTVRSCVAVEKNTDAVNTQSMIFERLANKLGARPCLLESEKPKG